MQGKKSAPPIEYNIGDEVSYSVASGVTYGIVTRMTGAGETQAIEIQFEDGHKEMKRARDRAVRLLRRRSGKSEVVEKLGDRGRLADPEIQQVFRSEQKKHKRGGL